MRPTLARRALHLFIAPLMLLGAVLLSSAPAQARVTDDGTQTITRSGGVSASCNVKSDWDYIDKNTSDYKMTVKCTLKGNSGKRTNIIYKTSSMSSAKELSWVYGNASTTKTLNVGKVSSVKLALCDSNNKNCGSTKTWTLRWVK